MSISDREMYRQRLMKIPTPELIVLYNGKAEYPEEKELRLSDAFKEMPGHREKYGSLDLTVRVLNINAGHNEDIVSKSPALNGYVTFIRKVRDGVGEGLELEKAVKKAVEYCSEHEILQHYLENHASEVFNMLTTEFNLEEAIAVWIEEGREENREIIKQKDAVIADNVAVIAQKDAVIADKDAEIADKDARIQSLLAMLEQREGSAGRGG